MASRMVQLSDRINALSLPALKRERARALTDARRATGTRRALAAQTVLLADARLGAEEPDDFEKRLSDARTALGREPTREQAGAELQAKKVRAAMTGSDEQANVAARARTVRASMEKARPIARSSPSGSFEDRLAAAKSAIGRS